MEIRIPKKLDLESSLNFCNVLKKLDDEEDYLYNYRDMNGVEPFGMLLTGSKIREFVKRNPESSHRVSNYEGKGYAAHMGFFQSVYLEFGKEPGQANGNENYIPLTCVDITESYKKSLCIYDYIEGIAGDLANVISRGDFTVKKHLKFCIYEILRNVYEHSRSKELWYAAQYWPKKDIVEIAILDEGDGIFNSLSRNKRIEFENDEEALKLSLEPGITKSLDRKSIDSKAILDNQGFGLYMTKNICEKFGSFVICSGDVALFFENSNSKVFSTSFKGTAVRLRLRVSKLKKAQELISSLSLSGTEKSEKLNKLERINLETLNKI